MTEYADDARYYRGERDNDPFSSLTLLNKRTNFVNPLTSLMHIFSNISDALFQRGKPLRDRLHDAYSKVPPPWL